MYNSQNSAVVAVCCPTDWLVVICCKESYGKIFVLQESDEQKQFSSKFSELQIEWPREFGEFLRLDESTTKSENDSNRPDSGVGESVRAQHLI